MHRTRESAVDLLRQLVGTHGGWQLRFRPDEVLLGDERVIGASPRTGSREDAVAAPETRLPFLFYRDGIRSLRILPTLPQEEALEFFDALVTGCNEKAQTDDLVTLLWQANLSHVIVEASPLEQTFFLAEPAPGGTVARAPGGEPGVTGGAGGAEVRVALGSSTAAPGLHVDTFDDWPLVAGSVDVREAFERLEANAEAACRMTLDQWTSENDGDWDQRVSEWFTTLVASDPSEDTRSAFACASATWTTGMIQQHQFARAAVALQLLDRLDADRANAATTLARGLAHVDGADLADALDEADPEDHGRFAALMVQLGEDAVPLTYAVMACATRSRVRAAAATALCYRCAERPKLLERFLEETRPEAMLNLVFVLGQIGGSDVVPMLQTVAKHADSRVRRQAVLSLGGVPEAERTPVLLDELARLDPHILSTTLGMLARQRDENVTRFILGLVTEPEFEGRSEDVQRTLFSALGEVANDTVVSALDKILNRSHGWLGRRTYTQFAAALTLRRLGTPAARRVLDLGLQSRDGSVRSACVDATNARGA